MNATIILFGATGDLAKRKIYPALYNLFFDKKMPEVFSVVGLGRRTLTHEAFQQQVEQSLRKFSRQSVNEVTLKLFLNAFRYSVLDVNQKEDYVNLLQLVEQREQQFQLSGNRMFYLSVAPEFFDIIASNIKYSGLGTTKGWRRLIIEKPFGRDLKSARELNEKLSNSFSEDEIYRIDHYLGKHMVQNLEVLESSNPMLRALWDNRYIANVQITASETVGVEERAGYYDNAGALRDMFQNHMLQLLMMISMRIPNNSTPEKTRFKKKLVMEALRPLDPEDISSNVILGQYASGAMQGKQVPAYTDEPDVPAGSNTETFIAAKLWIDNYFWNDVPIYIRTGKRMKEKSTRVVIQFKEPLEQHLKEPHETAVPNLMVIDIGPKEGIALQLNSKAASDQDKLEPVLVNCYSNNKDMPEAYENLIHDALRGDPTFFAHWNEVELSWQWVQPILDAVKNNLVPLHQYPAGSMGPEAADMLLGSDKWWLDPEEEAEAANTAKDLVHT